MPYAIISGGVMKASSISINAGAGFKWVTGTISQGDLSVSVTHNLGSVPTGYSLVATNNYGVGKIFVQPANILANSATIEITDAQPVDVTFLFGVIA